MTGIGSYHLSGRNFQYANPDRHEHFQLIIFADCFIGTFQHFMRRKSHHCIIIDENFGHHHK